MGTGRPSSPVTGAEGAAVVGSGAFGAFVALLKLGLPAGLNLVPVLNLDFVVCGSCVVLEKEFLVLGLSVMI